MKYAAIAACVGVYTVALMCRVLGIAPSGYYAWCRRPLSSRAARDRALTPHIRAAFTSSKGRYGSPRVSRRVARGAWHRAQAGRAADARRGPACSASTKIRGDHPVASRPPHRAQPRRSAVRCRRAEPGLGLRPDLPANDDWLCLLGCSHRPSRGASSAGRPRAMPTLTWRSRRSAEPLRCGRRPQD